MNNTTMLKVLVINILAALCSVRAQHSAQDSSESNELGFGNAFDRVTLSLAMYDHTPCDDEGHELNVDTILTDSLTHVSVIGTWVEDQVQELGEQISDSALCLFTEEDTVYELDFHDQELIARTEEIYVSDKPYMYVTKEQQALNFSFYMSKVATCNSPAELAKIAKTVISAQKVEEQGMFFFAAGQSKIFWLAYASRKADILDSSRLLVLEIMDAINAYNYASQVRKAKQMIYSENLAYADKRMLWDLCDVRLAKLA